MKKVQNLIREDFNTQAELLEHLAEMKSKDSAYEVFVPMVYYKTQRYKDFALMPRLAFKDRFISNFGRVITLTTTGSINLNKVWRKGDDGPLKVTVQADGKGVELDLLRAIASTFVEMPVEEIIAGNFALDPICLDGDMENTSIDNIYWADRSTAYTPSFLSIAKDGELTESDLGDDKEELFRPLSYTGLDWNSTDLLAFTTNLYWIGTKGTVWSFVNKRKPFALTVTLNEGKYPTVRVSLGGGKSFNIPVHRAMACTFLPVKDELGATIETLTVNHLDGEKWNYELSNLEWSTQQENVDHAFSTGLMKNKPVKGTFIEGEYVGKSFILAGGKDQKRNGFIPSNVCYVIQGKRKFHKGCVFAFATEEEIKELPRFDELAKKAAANPEVHDIEYMKQIGI